jgi:hypothetical protein
LLSELLSGGDGGGVLITDVGFPLSAIRKTFHHREHSGNTENDLGVAARNMGNVFVTDICFQDSL